MAFENLIDLIKLVLWLAALIFPAMYIANEILSRLKQETLFSKAAAVFLASLLIALAVYPFIAGLIQYIVALEYDVEPSLLLFDSDMATYLIMLLAVFLVYLLIFNKTKQE